MKDLESRLAEFDPENSSAQNAKGFRNAVFKFIYGRYVVTKSSTNYDASYTDTLNS